MVGWTIAFAFLSLLMFIALSIEIGKALETAPSAKWIIGALAAALALPLTLWWRHHVVNKQAIVAARLTKEAEELRAFEEEVKVVGEDEALLRRVGPLLFVGFVLSVFVLTAPILPIAVTFVFGGLIIAGSILWNRRTPPWP